MPCVKLYTVSSPVAFTIYRLNKFSSRKHIIKMPHLNIVYRHGILAILEVKRSKNVVANQLTFNVIPGQFRTDPVL